MKRYALLILIGILMLTSLACSVTINAPSVRSTVGPTETMEVNEPAPSGDARLVIGMGAGKLDVTGGGQGLVSGNIRYNVPGLKPAVKRNGSEVQVVQETDKLTNSFGNDLVNEWNLKLGNTPMDLTINAGAYEGTIDLSGVPLTGLAINDGASKAKVVINSPNPEQMDTLSYKTGASQVELDGLANANFKNMTFSGGAGNYTLDFSGELKQDAKVTITGGVSNVKIIVPSGMQSRITVTGGLNNITPRGTWTVEDKVYQTHGSGPVLTINLDMGVGNLELINR